MSLQQNALGFQLSEAKLDRCDACGGVRFVRHDLGHYHIGESARVAYPEVFIPYGAIWYDGGNMGPGRSLDAGCSLGFLRGTCACPGHEYRSTLVGKEHIDDRPFVGNQKEGST